MFVVSIEGIDGTGKSTLVDKLEEYVNDIKEVGDNYWEHIQFTRFPTRYFFERIANFNSKETITDADMLRLQDEDKLHEINKRRQQGCKDRKSTRLNSSHVAISYAVFCLKKKKIPNN